MVRKVLLLALGVCFLNAAAALAADPQIGTWKLNEAKSKFSPGSPKRVTSGSIACFAHWSATTPASSGWIVC